MDKQVRTMYEKKSEKYSKLADNDDSVLGFQVPADTSLIFLKQTDDQINAIYYTDVNHAKKKITAEQIAPFLREVRNKGNAAWGFAQLFQNQGLAESDRILFETFVKESKTTALMDYWLLRLGGHISVLQGKNGLASQNEDAQYLSSIHQNLTELLQTYEEKMGQLANNPSRHQNEQRTKLVAEFQKDWQEIIKPATEKYKKTDTHNILLNVGAACTGIGLIWLFCKNLYRLSQRKGLGLFQFEQAHSRKIEPLTKLYEDVAKATEADAAKLENYFSNDIQDAYQSYEQLKKIVAELQKLHSTLALDGTYTRKEKKALLTTVTALTGELDAFQRDLSDCESDRTDGVTLAEIQIEFMEAWNKIVTVHELADHQTILESKYPLACTTKFSEIVQISDQFKEEIKRSKQTDTYRPSSPTLSHSDEDTI